MKQSRFTTKTGQFRKQNDKTPERFQRFLLPHHGDQESFFQDNIQGGPQRTQQKLRLIPILFEDQVAGRTETINNTRISGESNRNHK